MHVSKTVKRKDINYITEYNVFYVQLLRIQQFLERKWVHLIVLRL